MAALTLLRQWRRPLWGLLAIGGMCVVGVAMGATAPPSDQSSEDDVQIARSLATMLRAARTVISKNQDRINDPNLSWKGLEGSVVLKEATKLYQAATGVDPNSLDEKSRHAKLLQIEMDSIVEVMDGHQTTINRKGVGFKGFIPAVFGRLVCETFGRRAAGIAEMKVTAPLQLIRNAKARPDTWETKVISEQLQSPNWPKDQTYAAVTESRGRTAHRTALPEYYGASCLSCHGSPKLEIDITGYPKEGANEGDLGGVISITLFR
jgi:hypothetical protein